MESTTNGDESVTPYSPCNTDNINNFGSQLSILFYFMFLFSLFGNGLVLVIIYRFEKLTTVTNILLLNLVLSSLIFMSSLPFNGVYMQLSNWIFGKAMCKIVGSAYYLGFYSSVLFLTLLTFDRHLAVVYSLSGPRVRNLTYAIVSCVVVWLVSGLACIHKMIIHIAFFYEITGKTYCQEYPYDIDGFHVELLKESGIYIQFFLFFVFPLAVIIYCYTRIAITVLSSRIVTKFKTVRLVFIIVLLFFVCWSPLNIALLKHHKATTCKEKQKWTYALHITSNIAYFYFCISPIFYTFVGKKFQGYFKQLLVKHFPGMRKYILVSQINETNMSTKTTPNEV